MSSPEDTSAKITLKLAGVFQEVRDSWVKRIDLYFDQLLSLIEGDWFESSDMVGLLREARMASREALDGLGTDLSSELVHASSGIVQRYEYERASLTEEINDLRIGITRALAGDENEIRRENETMREALHSVPEYQILKYIRLNSPASYAELSKLSGVKKGQLRKLVKSLMERGHVSIDKKTRPHKVIFLSAPWRRQNPPEEIVGTYQSTLPSALSQ